MIDLNEIEGFINEIEQLDDEIEGYFYEVNIADVTSVSVNVRNIHCYLIECFNYIKNQEQRIYDLEKLVKNKEQQNEQFK
jgi:hypothetical protein